MKTVQFNEWVLKSTSTWKFTSKQNRKINLLRYLNDNVKRVKNPSGASLEQSGLGRPGVMASFFGPSVLLPLWQLHPPPVPFFSFRSHSACVTLYDPVHRSSVFYQLSIPSYTVFVFAFRLETFLETSPELRGSSLITALILADPLKERGFDVCCFPPLLSWDFHLSDHLSALAQCLVCSFVHIKAFPIVLLYHFFITFITAVL